MRRNGNRNKIRLIFLAVAFVFVAVIAFPLSYTLGHGISAIQEDYDTFYSSYMDMIRTYDVEDVVSANETKTEENPARLIVFADEKINTKGAISTASYDGVYFLQYKNEAGAAKAYRYYEGLDNVRVMYDYDVKVEDEVVSINATTYNSTSSYNSWGWQERYNFMGAVPYLAGLVANGVIYTETVVAVLDSGINTSHEMFTGRIVSNYAKNFTTEDSVEDQKGHGTHVSGTIAEITPDAVKILPLKVLNYKGEGKVSYILSALEYMINLKKNNTLNIKVANMSLGVTSTSVTTDLKTKIDAAYDRGIVSVVSAGNGDDHGNPIDAGNVEPANVTKAFTISALKKVVKSATYYMQYDGSYSNYGDVVDFCAPGTNITSAYIGSATATAELSGTSMAAPHVSACVALFYVNPANASVSIAELETKLIENADKSRFYSMGAPYDVANTPGSRNKYYGYGCVNIENLSVNIEGDVDFDVANRFQTGSFTLHLSYPENTSAEIWYTTDEDISSSDIAPKAPMVRYNSSNPLNITKSTQITAVAYVYSGTSIVMRSEITTRVYYVNNYDIESNYTIATNGTITSYSGTELTTLNIPNMIGTTAVKSIGKNAFTYAVATTINLPKLVNASDTLTINESGFVQNTKLVTINCDATQRVKLGKCAFQKCTKLANFNVPNVIEVGESAFAYDKMTELKLLNATSVGNNAISASSIQDIYFGKNTSSIGTQVQLSALENVYGYRQYSAAEDFAYKTNVNFYDMTLEITQDFPTQKIIKRGGGDFVSLEFSGYDIHESDCVVTTTMGSSHYTMTLTHPSTTRNVLTIQFQNSIVVRSYTLSVTISDEFDTITSQNVVVKVLSSSTTEYHFEADEGNYLIYVDGVVVDETFKLFAGETYNVAIRSEVGYQVREIKIDGTDVNEGQVKVVQSVSDNVPIQLYSVATNNFLVSFEVEKDANERPEGNVYVDGVAVTHIEVSRNADTSYKDLSFTIVGNSGYFVKRVVANGSLLSPVDGVYTLTEVKEDYEVVVDFEKASYSIEITYVKACGTYAARDLTSVDHGDSREITIYAKSGYKIDFVAVNGKNVQVKNGTFVIDDVEEDKAVVVSFKKSFSSIFDDDSMILYYFIIFAVIVVLFVAGKIALYFVLKKQNEQKH